jgi:FAD dependent oxidoreductase
MVERCKRLGIQPVLCTAPPINPEPYFQRHAREKFDEAGGLEKVLDTYRSAVLRVAEARSIPVVDLNRQLAAQPAWQSADGVHPAPKGNQIIAQLVAEKVRPMITSANAAATPAGNAGHQASAASKGVVKLALPPADGEADVVIYGGTSAGVIAAVQATRMGKSVMLIEPGKHIGGMTSGGLGATDIGNKGVIGGLSREFYQRVAKHYADDAVWKREKREEYFANNPRRTKLEEVMGPDAAMWTFEPHVADKILREMLAEAKVPVRLEQRLASVKKESARITEIKLANGDVCRAKVFIDATYEGDLMAKAGVSYRVGREANSEFKETLNGIRANTPKNQIQEAVDPYVVPGDPSSGLIPLIQSGDGGTPGEGDHRVQAYNFRLCFTDVPENRLTLTPPKNYDPALYELAARRVAKLVESGAGLSVTQFCNPVWMPNRKTDINNHEGISTDLIGMNYDYPDGDPATRARIWQAHEDYIRGYWYFMSSSPRVPESLRQQFQALGPAKDEFRDTGGWPHQLYVREARRMVSDYVMTEHNCRSKAVAADPVGMAAYGMDSHNCQRIVQNGLARNEGDVQQHGLKPYPISYRAIVPKAAECENLLVPVCLSATHIAYGSIRMEPVFMVLGQSAATAAVLAAEGKLAVQAVPYTKLRDQLLKDGQRLVTASKSAAPKK